MYDSIYIRVPVKYKDKYHSLSKLKKKVFMVEASILIMKLLDKYESLTEDEVLKMLRQEK